MHKYTLIQHWSTWQVLDYLDCEDLATVETDMQIDTFMERLAEGDELEPVELVLLLYCRWAEQVFGGPCELQLYT